MKTWTVHFLRPFYDLQNLLFRCFPISSVQTVIFWPEIIMQSIVLCLHGDPRSFSKKPGKNLALIDYMLGLKLITKSMVNEARKRKAYPYIYNLCEVYGHETNRTTK